MTLACPRLPQALLYHIRPWNLHNQSTPHSFSTIAINNQPGTIKQTIGTRLT
jgi:hypothetical protein